MIRFPHGSPATPVVVRTPSPAHCQADPRAHETTSGPEGSSWFLRTVRVQNYNGLACNATLILLQVFSSSSLLLPIKSFRIVQNNGRSQPMDRKIPTIEALDAAFKAREIKNIEDLEKEATWFLGAINKSDLLKREVLQVLHAMRNQAGMDPEQFVMSPGDISQWILQISARFFFIGWVARGAVDDRRHFY